MGLTRSYIHCWTFGPEGQPYVLSDSTKLTVVKGGIPALKPIRQPVFLPGRGALAYSTDADLYIRTRAYTPTIKTSWDFIEPFTNEPVDADGNQVTLVQYRIHDGTNSLYWDGAAWSAAGAGNWNTLDDINANLSAYTGASLAIEANLSTTDPLLTPSITFIKLRWTGRQITFFEEWIYNVVVASMQDSIRPFTDFSAEADGSSSIAVGTLEFDADFDITEVVCVFDHTADPNHTTDLFSTYDTGTKVVGLTTPIPAGNTAFITAKYKPMIAVTTSSDYNEESRVPSILVSAIEPTARKWLGASGPGVIDRTLPIPAGTVFPNPIPLRDIDFSIATHAPGALDLLKLNEAFSEWMNAHPVLRSKALDLGVRMNRGPLLNWSTGESDPNDLRGPAVGGFRLMNVPDFGNPFIANENGEATQTMGPVDAGDPNHPGVGYGVKRFNQTFNQGDGPGSDDIQVTK